MNTYTSPVRFTLILATVAGISFSSVAQAQKNVFNSLSDVYTENFGVPINSSQPRPWTDNQTLTGWYGLVDGETPSTYIVSAGAASTGSIMAYGPSVGQQPSTAFGMLTTTTHAQVVMLALELTNNTGSTIHSVTVSFDQLQWYGGTGAANDKFAAAYGIGVTDPWATDASSGFTVLPDLDVKGFVSGNGKLAEPVAKSVSYTLENIEWESGQSLWLRWIDSDVSGGDAGAGFSNMTISVSAIPEPATISLGMGIAVLAGVVTWRRLRGRRA